MWDSPYSLNNNNDNDNDYNNDDDDYDDDTHNKRMVSPRIDL